MKKKNLLMTAIAIFGLATITMAQVPSYVPTNGLVGWWPFNGNANDLSGNGNNGTIISGPSGTCTYSDDRNGIPLSSLLFNGNPTWNATGSYVEVLNNTSLNFNNAYTVNVWVNFSNNIITGELINKGPDNNGYFISRINNLQMSFGTFNGGIISSVLNPNTWFMFTMVRDMSGNGVLYINGNPVSSGIIGTPPNNNYDLWFGLHQYGNNGSMYPFQGYMDDIGIWNRALTTQEVAALYNGCQLSVNTQPTDQTINVNNNAQFVVSSSDPSATFQWQTDLGVGFQNLNSVGQYSGTTNDTLTVSNVTLSNNNQQFRCIISSGSCSDTSNVAVLTVNNNVGINETTQANLFSVFPNPAQSIINVKADSKLIGEVYTIYDNAGRVVLTGKLNSENTTIELNNLSGGVYMFSVGENMKQTFKVIKE